MQKLLVVMALLALIYGLGCSSKKEVSSGPAPLNPNGDSELAMLMRAMYEDGMTMKEAIQKGELPESHVDLTNLYTDDAAEPDKVASPQYKAYAQIYEAAVAAINNAEGAQKIAAYRSMVGACMSCHQAMCPGPMVRIRNMEL